MAVVRCSGCKRYIPRSDAIRIGLSAFCSQECVYDKSRKTQAKAAKKSRSKRAPMDSALRDGVIISDGFRCRYCGRGGTLHVHHVLYRSEQGPDSRDNLISLCGDHHQLVHSDKKLYQPLCLEIIRRREADGDLFTLIPELEISYG